MDKIIMAPTDLLVRNLEDYYKKSNDFTTAESVEHSVGVIENVGKSINEEWIGKVVYYHKNIATKVNLKGIGSFDVVTENIVLLVRLDQDVNNY